MWGIWIRVCQKEIWRTNSVLTAFFAGKFLFFLDHDKLFSQFYFFPQLFIILFTGFNLGISLGLVAKLCYNNIWPLLWNQCSVWVARRPPGYAFIEFDDKRDALDAIRALDGKNETMFKAPWKISHVLTWFVTLVTFISLFMSWMMWLSATYRFSSLMFLVVRSYCTSSICRGMN